MLQPDTLEIPRVQDAASCRRWIEAIDGDDGARLQLVDRLVASLARSRQPADQLFEIVEQARPVQVAAADALLGELASSPFPLPAPAWQRVQTVLRSLRAARDLYQHIYTRLVDNSGLSTRTVIPGAADSLRTVMPLGRALDYQARAIGAAARLRVAIDPQDWRASCTLAACVRRSTFIDDVLPDAAPTIRSATSRALFVYPLLLQLARLDTRSEHATLLIDRLARRWAGKVGFRIDEDGRLHENRHGPTVPIDAQVSVRLDTHKLLRSLDARLHALGEGHDAGEMRLPRGMTIDQARRLLDELRLCWSAAWRPDHLGARPTLQARARFGMPVPQTVTTDDGTEANAGGVAGASYVYGRFESNTIIRLALGAQKPVSDPVAALMDGSLQVAWGCDAHGHAIVETSDATGTIQLGTLVLLTALPPPHIGRERRLVSRLLLGRVVSLEHVAQPAADSPDEGRFVEEPAPPAAGAAPAPLPDAAQASTPVAQAAPPLLRIGVTTWQQSIALVGIRVGDAPFYDDAFRIEGDPDSVIVATGRWRMDAPAMLRLPDQDLRIRFGQAIERGVGFERVRIEVLGP